MSLSESDDDNNPIEFVTGNDGFSSNLWFRI